MSSTRGSGCVRRSLIVALVAATSTVAAFSSVTQARAAMVRGGAISSRALLKDHINAAVRLYETYIDHILDMADMLSTGIIQQFSTVSEHRATLSTQNDQGRT